MAKRIVDVLEMVKINIQQCKTLGTSARPHYCLIECLDEDAAVCKARQSIVAGHLAKLTGLPLLAPKKFSYQPKKCDETCDRNESADPLPDRTDPPDRQSLGLSGYDVDYQGIVMEWTRSHDG